MENRQLTSSEEIRITIFYLQLLRLLTGYAPSAGRNAHRRRYVLTVCMYYRMNPTKDDGYVSPS